MQPLRSVLMAFAERAGVAGAVVVSDDGLVVESSVPTGRDAEALSALGTSAARTLEALSQSSGLGRFEQAVLDGEAGAAILQRLPSGALFIVLAADHADLGALLYDVRRHAPALVSLL